MKQLRSWHWSTLKVVSEPMSALARTSERDGRTRTTNENCTANESWTRTKYIYDAENRITKASGMSSGPYTYTYNGEGLRLRKTNGAGGTLYWRGLGGDALAETDLAGNVTSEYVFFAGRIVARMDASGNTFYYNSDSLGTTKTITDANGHVCFDSEFTPYGQEMNHTNACPQNYKFTSYEFDSETGLYYASARYYNSRLGRFMSPDPLNGSLGDPQSLNLYGYVRNNPVNLADPSGAQTHVTFPAIGCDESNSNGMCARYGSQSRSNMNCILDGVSASCNMTFGMILNGDAAICPHNNCLGWQLADTGGPGSFIRDPTGTRLDAATMAAEGCFSTGPASATCTLSFRAHPNPVNGTWSNLGVRILAGSSNFFAGAGDCLTGRCIPFVHNSLTEWARRLNGADAVVNKTGFSYAAGEFTGGVVGSALLSAGGATAAAIADGRNGAFFGRAVNNPLFNGNALGTGSLRFGWGWKGAAKGGRNVIRLGIGAARGTNWWNHIIFWSRWI